MSSPSAASCLVRATYAVTRPCPHCRDGRQDYGDREVDCDDCAGSGSIRTTAFASELNFADYDQLSEADAARAVAEIEADLAAQRAQWAAEAVAS